jgi:hypothetical protein
MAGESDGHMCVFVKFADDAVAIGIITSAARTAAQSQESFSDISAILNRNSGVGSTPCSV